MIKRLTFALAMSLAVAFMPTATASAAEYPVEEISGHGFEACPEASLCLYEHSNFNGDENAKIWVITGSTERIPGGSDEASSAYLNASVGDRAYLYRDVKHEGDRYRLPGGRTFARWNLKYAAQGTETYNFNDSISSVKLYLTP
ncbi:peptidase inhibitor family I36 protein [Streptomyces sp. NPDC058953]|uniref:peptidase inhibitor family I36 protein n=1 Tax=unclassified Streptomyces TaxID=2593676 RepID=UPI0036BBD8B1